MALASQHTFQVLTKRADRMRSWIVGREGFIRPLAASGGATVAGELEPLRWPLPNVWLGVSVEDQARADERIPLLLETPATKRFISAEPLLGPIDLTRWIAIDWQCNYCREFFSGGHKSHCPSCGKEGGWTGSHAFNGRGYPKRPGFPIDRGSGLDWVIVGGESGANARPMHPDWPRSLRDQCRAAGVAFHFKQWGEWSPHAPPGCKSEPMPGFQPGDFPHMWRVGKKAAGRLLDGVEWSEFPELANG